MFTLSSHLWTPQRRGLEQTIELLREGHDLCLYGPTGSGKTVQAEELCRWAVCQGNGVCFYLPRKLLVAQTLPRFQAAGLEVGVRAAEYEDYYNPDAPVQICSADTERHRVLKEDNRHGWDFHDAGLVIIDEGHIQKASTMQRIVKEHRENGARIVLLTATPIGLSHMVRKLIVSGTMQEYRDCGALSLATVKGIEQPDMSKVQRNQVGEYILNGRKKKIFVQSIIGNVIDRWRRYNPDARQTMAYWPGKPESIWGTAQFTRIGAPFCHVDANDAVVPEWKTIEGTKVLRTRRVKLTRRVWAEILARFKDGDIVGLSSRFKLREGIDVPFVYHGILATPIGSISSYIQTVGRILRRSPETSDGVLITDHGGNYWQHGSPNANRPWHDWWDMKETTIIQERERGLKDHGEKEPMRCRKCSGEFERVIYTSAGEPCCPHCKEPFHTSRREVVMTDGRMKTVDGPLVKPTVTKIKDDTEKKWCDMFWGFKRKEVNMSFAQMEGFFAKENGYHPPRDLPYMPLEKRTWKRIVHKTEFDRLVPAKPKLDTVSSPSLF